MLGLWRDKATGLTYYEFLENGLNITNQEIRSEYIQKAIDDIKFYRYTCFMLTGLLFIIIFINRI